MFDHDALRREITETLDEQNERYGPLHPPAPPEVPANGARPPAEIIAARAALRAATGKYSPHLLTQLARLDVRGAPESALATPRATTSDGFVCLSEVEEREIDWFWPGRIARANVVVLAGDGGIGKSTLAQEIGARVSRGQAPPGGSPDQPRSVLVLTAEEDASAVIRPRMRMMGADLERVFVLDPEEAGMTFPSGADRLETRCRVEGAGLVVIDTGPAFLDRDLSSNNEEDVRRFIAPLRLLAERLRLVVIVLAHLNKATGMSAGHRLMGGVAWRNAPRQVLLVGAPPGQDPRETGDRLVGVEKNNLGVYPPAFAFRLAPAPEDATRAVVAWGQEVDGVRVADLVKDPPSEQERAESLEASEMLLDLLSGGPLKADDFQRQANAAGIGRNRFGDADARLAEI